MKTPILFVLCWLTVQAVRAAEETPGQTAATQNKSTIPVQERLARITLPEITFREAKITDIVVFLNEQGRLHDPQKEGINIVLEAQQAKPVTLNLRNIPLGEAIKYTAQLSGLQLRYEANAVVFCSFGGPQLAVTSPTAHILTTDGTTLARPTERPGDREHYEFIRLKYGKDTTGNIVSVNQKEPKTVHLVTGQIVQVLEDGRILVHAGLGAIITVVNIDTDGLVDRQSIRFVARRTGTYKYTTTNNSRATVMEFEECGLTYEDFLRAKYVERFQFEMKAPDQEEKPCPMCKGAGVIRGLSKDSPCPYPECKSKRSGNGGGFRSMGRGDFSGMQPSK